MLPTLSPRRLAPMLAAALAATSGPAAAQAPAPAVIVVDGSGSMWGNLGAERLSKFDLARAALRQSFAGISPEARIGLVSFGHRRRGDCSDVETIAPPEAGPADRIPTLVDKINPKGKGPLTLGLKEGARLLGTEPGTLILVHDGPDNCQQDPCAAAAELSKSNPGLVVHVIGLALEKVDAQRMSCMARATKGKMLEARDAASLNAAIGEAVQLARLVPGAAPPEAAGASSQIRPPAPQPADHPSGLHLSASLAEDGPAITRPLPWRVVKAEATSEIVIERTAPEVSAKLAPGKYVVETRLGIARASQAFEIGEDGAAPVRVVLGAGTLKLAARANKNLDPLADPMLTVSAGAQAEGEEKVAWQPVWIGRDPDAEIVVPAGRYEVRADDGLASRSMTIDVAAGARADVALVLGTGRLELSAVPYEGAEPLTEVIYTIAEDDPDAPQGRREIARSADPRATFTLAAGTYYASASLGAIETRERIAIGTGAVVTQTLVLNAARLLVSAQLDGAPPPGDHPIVFRVLRLDDGAREVARSAGPAPAFLLSPGRYRVEAKAGTLNAKAAAEVDLAAGREQRIALKLEAPAATGKSRASGETSKGDRESKGAR